MLINLTKELIMKPEVNAVLEQAKANMATPTTPDFKTMSIMEATKWCMERGYDKPADIVSMTGKTSQSVYTAMWKLRNPKRVKVLARRAKKRKASGMVVSVKKAKAKPTSIATEPPLIRNGYYNDGMETPFLDALNRKTQRFNFLDEERQPMHELMAENRRLKILVEHYESILFKGGK